MSACSPEFAPHVKTLHWKLGARTLSNRSGDQEPGQENCELPTSTGSQQVVNMEILKISKPIVSAGKMVRSRRRIVLDEHDSFIEDKKTGETNS